MKNILLIGVGGTGSNAVDILYRKIREMGNQTDNRITALVFDTDVGAISNITAATALPLADPAGVGAICDRLGCESLREWFPCDEPSVRAQEMTRGASQWRKKSYLSFLNLMSKSAGRSAFHRALENMALEPGVACEIYVIASVAGGTGSGTFIPIALYAKRFLRQNLNKEPIVNAMIALPDIYADSQTPDNRVKIYANAYAIFRELNAINLVARGGNSASRVDKKAPIRLKIGSAKDPNVGVLFDAEDPACWTPLAAPFSQVFLLDKIPGVHSVQAHDIVLANSLYTLLCTDMGAEFDAEYSNHATGLSQGNGSNAIYAGISSSQVVFPYESVLNYLAHEKALRSCEEEWLLLHNATESMIREKETEAKEAHRRFMLGDGDYAALVLTCLQNEYDTPTGTVSELVDRATACFDPKTGQRLENNTADLYFGRLDAAIGERMAGNKDIGLHNAETMFSDFSVSATGGWRASAAGTEDVIGNAEEMNGTLLAAFRRCIAYINESTQGLTEAILTFDKRKDPCANGQLSAVENLLKSEGKYLHPVTAMVQLCRLRVLIRDFLKKHPDEWEELHLRHVDRLPERVMKVGDADSSALNLRPGRSVYGRIDSRMLWLINFPDKYRNCKTDAYTDNAYLINDFTVAARMLKDEAVNQLKRAVYLRLSHRLDLLIAKYRDFFNRFEKGKADLAENTRIARLTDSGRADSVLNVFSDEASKQAILKAVLEADAGESAEDVIENEDTVGSGVFDTVYHAAMAAEASRNAPSEFRLNALFDGMVAACRRNLQKKDAFAPYREMNVVEALRQSAGDEDREAFAKVISSAFVRAAELARPALQVNRSLYDDRSVAPSDTMVVLLSAGTAEYIKRHSEEFGLHLPLSGTSGETILRAAAEEFVRHFAGSDSLRVAVVKDMSDRVIYFTGEILDITPIRIDKLDEMGNNPYYYQQYRTAIVRMNRYETDMWNPHLGYGFHKRGCLPFMNPRKEEEEDTRLTKALLYALTNNQIYYKKKTAQIRGCFRCREDGAEKMLLSNDGLLITPKNLSKLLEWLRGREEKMAEWSDAFDLWFTAEKNRLAPAGATGSDAALKASLTNSGFIKMLKSNLYEREDSSRVGLLELAFAIKCSEESSRDCNDAERILRTAGQLFMDFVSFRVNPQGQEELFTSVYTQQIGNFYQSFAEDCLKVKGADPLSYFCAVLEWVNGAGVFMTIDQNNILDEHGKLAVDKPFRLEAGEDGLRIKNLLQKGRVNNAGTDGAGTVDVTGAEEEE